MRATSPLAPREPLPLVESLLLVELVETPATRNPAGRVARHERIEAKASSHTSAGFTLVELLVYVSLFVIVLVIVGSFLINSLQAEKTVRSSADAATYGQLLSQSIQHGVRNASAIALTTPVNAAKKIPAGSQLLTVELFDGAGDTPTKKCQAWLYVPDVPALPGGQIFVRPMGVTPVGIPNLSGSFVNGRVIAPSGWSLYGEGIKPAGAAPFEAVGSGAGKGVKFDFALSVTGSAPVQLRGQEFSRQNPVGSTSSCF